MSLHLIKTIAKYEMRTLLRSWFFRIFVLLSVVGLGIFNIALNVNDSDAPWIYRALGASIPYANLIILNLGQAIVAVFLASEFMKQDRKNDTVEVIYVRSMSNSQYIIGKTLGILAVFFVLNLLILLMGVGFSFISNATSLNVLSYLTYPLLISLPTLVFILGLSFFMMVLVKNQALTFILLLGYIALSIFYLNQKLFHLFDYIAYHVPMMYSSISGFANFREILLHRSIYFFLGIGFIAFTVFRLQRLPQHPKTAAFPLYVGLLFLILAGVTIYLYLNGKQTSRLYRQTALELNNKFVGFPRATVSDYSITLEHRGEKIEVEALIKIINRTNQPIDTLIFSLNPGLSIQKITIEGIPAAFARKSHIVIIPLKVLLQPQAQVTVAMSYNGGLDENICFLDKDVTTFEDNFNLEVFTLRKSYFFLHKNYVCLTSESLWYPISGVGYSSSRPLFYPLDFANYTLKVKTSPKLTVISQGQITQLKPGEFECKPEYPLTKISLLIGNYRKYSLKVDSIEYNIFTIYGNEYFEPAFKQIADTLPALIREIKKDFELKLQLAYPFKRLTFAEVPIHFAMDNHNYSYTSDAVQPEMVLYPEKGVLFKNSDFNQQKFWIEKGMKRNNEAVLPAEIQSRMFKELIINNLAAEPGFYFDFDAINHASYSLFSQYYSFVTQLNSQDWPLLNTAIEAYLMEEKVNGSATSRNYDDENKEEKINLELNRSSLRDLLTKNIWHDENENEPVLLRDFALSKGKYLINLLKAKYGEAAMDSFLLGLIKTHLHKTLHYHELRNSFDTLFTSNLNSYLQSWYNQPTSSGFEVENVSSYKVVTSEATKFQIKFTITNPEINDGLVSLNVELNNPNRKGKEWWDNDIERDFSRKIFVAAKTSNEVGFVFDTEPRRMQIVTHISKNLPNKLNFDFKGFAETRNTKVLDTIVEIPFAPKLNNTNEIIVDNEDQGFSVEQTTDQAYLKSIVRKGKKSQYPYSGIRNWHPPRNWEAVLNTDFYGRYIRSALYTGSGAGERRVFWKAVLPKKTMYDVYFFLYKTGFGGRRNPKPADYNLVVYHDGGKDKININSENEDTGWVFLGSYSISDTAKIELSNKSVGNMVFADAVKWVPSK